MARYVTSITTPLSPAEAFAYMADVTRFVEWDPTVRRAVRVPGRGTGVGDAYDLTIRTLTTIVLRYEVVEHEPPRRLLLVARSRLLQSVDEITIEPAGSGSIVRYDAKLNYRGPLNVLDPVLQRGFGLIGRRAEAGLRRVLASPRAA